MSASTLWTYERRAMPVIKEYCASIGDPAVPASPLTVLAFVGAAATGRLRRPGKSPKQTGEATPLSPSSLDVLLAAWRYAHESAGLESPTGHPAVRAACETYRSDRAADGYRAQRAVPATPEHLATICGHAAEVSHRRVATAAAALVMLAFAPSSVESLARMRLRDLRCGAAVVLCIDGMAREVPCSCVDLWGEWAVRPCAACLLRLLEGLVKEEDDLLFAACRMKAPKAKEVNDAAAIAQRMRTLCRRLPEFWPATRFDADALRWVEGVGSEAGDATVHGIGLALTGQLVVLMSRSMWLLMFLRGLRFEDVTSIPLHLVTRRVGDVHFWVCPTKHDMDGRWLKVRPTRADRLCAVCALDEWLWVLSEATLVPDAQLFMPVGPYGPRAGGRTEYPASFMEFRRQCIAAGITEPLSLHSMRRGFATLARADGASLEAIQDALGHARVDTTLKYLGDEPDDGAPPQAVAVLAGLATPGAACPTRAEPPVFDTPHRWADHRDSVAIRRPDGAGAP